MSVHFDDKGKYFTEVMAKVTLEVVVQTTKHRIHGYLHITPERRLIDELNNTRMFLAITDARVESSGYEMTTSFLALHKEQILWITPVEDLIQEVADGG